MCSALSKSLQPVYTSLEFPAAVYLNAQWHLRSLKYCYCFVFTGSRPTYSSRLFVLKKACLTSKTFFSGWDGFLCALKDFLLFLDDSLVFSVSRTYEEHSLGTFEPCVRVSFYVCYRPGTFHLASSKCLSVCMWGINIDILYGGNKRSCCCIYIWSPEVMQHTASCRHFVKWGKIHRICGLKIKCTCSLSQDE